MSSPGTKSSRVMKYVLSSLLVFTLFAAGSNHAAAQIQPKIGFESHAIFMSSSDKILKIPTPVTGLRVVSVDKYYRRITLEWSASPASEKVDSYAIYSKDANKPGDLGMELNAVTKGTSATLSTWSSGATGVKPTHSVLMELGDYSVFWVIAHNRYGWGESVGGPYPGNSRPPNLSRSQQISDYPFIEQQDWVCTKIISSFYPKQCP